MDFLALARQSGLDTMRFSIGELTMITNAMRASHNKGWHTGWTAAFASTSESLEVRPPLDRELPYEHSTATPHQGGPF